jgi:hypothetical protein
VLELGPNWGAPVSLGFKRSGNDERVGRGRAVTTRGAGPQPLIGFQALAQREEYYALLRFFDAHRGGAVPFFVIDPVTVYEATNIGSSFVDLAAFGVVDDMAENLDSTFPYVAIETTDGDIHVRQNVGVAVVDGDVRMSVSPDWPALSVPEIRRCTVAHHVRFDDDVLRESWATTDVVSLELRMLDLLYVEREVAL